MAKDVTRKQRLEKRRIFFFVQVFLCDIFFVGALFFFVIPVKAGISSEVDTDGDGLTNVQEQTLYFTNPYNVDTDGDGFDDGLEIAHGYSPRYAGGKRLVDVDSDKDYLNDDWELKLGTGIMNPDTDGDLYLDGTEVAAGYSPLAKGEVKMEKFIQVNLAKQELVYTMGGVTLDHFPISSGVASMPTPTGTFTVLDKVPSKTYGGDDFNFYYPNTKWNLHFTTKYWRYYIHGAYWHHNFGHPMSHGCVNVDYDHMERLYWWAQQGTKIVIQ